MKILLSALVAVNLYTCLIYLIDNRIDLNKQNAITINKLLEIQHNNAVYDLNRKDRLI